MTTPLDTTRRSLLTGMMVGTSSLLLGSPARAASSQDLAVPPSLRPLGSVWKIEQATIISMDDDLGLLRQGDILVRNGVIDSIAPHIDAPDAEIIDGRHHIAFPGFVDAHTHMWQTQMRGMFGQRKGTLFFPLTDAVDDAFRPQDVAVSMQMTAFENAFGGITTSNDFFDNNRSPDFTEAALVDMPIRKRLLYGNSSKTTPDGIDLAHLAELQKGWSGRSATQSLGMAWRLPRNLQDADAMAMKKREYDFARSHDLPIAVHVSGPNHHAMFQTLVDGKYLFPGLQVIHATDARAEHLAALETAGASLALSPLTEHRVGFGLTRYSHFKEISRIGLGIDGNGLAGSADMFANMRLMAMTEIGASHDQTSIDPHHLFAMATIGGARSMGLDGSVGSLSPGKQADIAMVDTRALNLGMVGDDPITQLIFCAKPDNVDFVSVGGKAVKREGELVNVDMGALLARIDESVNHLHQALKRKA